SLPAARYADARTRRQFVDAVLSEMSSLPSVVDAAVTTSLPYDGYHNFVHFWPDDVPVRETTATDVLQQVITPTALTLLKVPLVSGRMLAATDREGSLPVALVSRALAERLWHSTAVVGRRFRLGADIPPVTIVGVVGDVAPDWIAVTRSDTIYLS